MKDDYKLYILFSKTTLKFTTTYTPHETVNDTLYKRSLREMYIVLSDLYKMATVGTHNHREVTRRVENTVRFFKEHFFYFTPICLFTNIFKKAFNSKWLCKYWVCNQTWHVLFHPCTMCDAMRCSCVWLLSKCRIIKPVWIEARIFFKKMGFWMLAYVLYTSVWPIEYIWIYLCIWRVRVTCMNHLHSLYSLL